MINKKLENVVHSISLDNKKNKLLIDEDVLIDIIGRSAPKIAGFVRFSESFADKISMAIDEAKKYSGITINTHIDENEINIIEIDLSIVLEYAVNIYDVCYNIKSGIKSAIEKKYSGTNVSSINIYVSAMENNKKKQGRK